MKTVCSHVRGRMFKSSGKYLSTFRKVIGLSSENVKEYLRLPGPEDERSQYAGFPCCGIE